MDAVRFRKKGSVHPGSRLIDSEEAKRIVGDGHRGDRMIDKTPHHCGY